MLAGSFRCSSDAGTSLRHACVRSRLQGIRRTLAVVINHVPASEVEMAETLKRTKLTHDLQATPWQLRGPVLVQRLWLYAARGTID